MNDLLKIWVDGKNLDKFLNEEVFHGGLNDVWKASAEEDNEVLAEVFISVRKWKVERKGAICKVVPRF